MECQAIQSVNRGCLADEAGGRCGQEDDVNDNVGRIVILCKDESTIISIG